MSNSSPDSTVSSACTSQPAHHVVQFTRRPYPGAYSIEGVFWAIRAELPREDWQVEVRQAPHFSRGILPRVRNAIWAGRISADVIHILGDVHYLALATPPNRTLLTIHDLEMLSRLRGLKRRIVKRYWFDLPVRNVGAITVISQATKTDLLSKVHVEEDRLFVVPDAVSPVFQPAPREFNADWPRILQIGVKHNKNVLRLIDALSGLRCHLHLIGRPTPELTQRLAKGDVQYTLSQDLTNEEMYTAYQTADMVTLASTSEGFGMPIAEAQWVERPVVTSNCSAMPEVAGAGARYVDPFDVSSIRAGIQQVIADSSYRDDLISAGRVNRERFNARTVARQYASIYEQLL